MPLPGRNPTLGFHSATNEGVKIGNTLYEDARTTEMWYIMSSIGRLAGHLAFGISTHNGGKSPKGKCLGKLSLTVCNENLPTVGKL